VLTLIQKAKSGLLALHSEFEAKLFFPLLRHNKKKETILQIVCCVAQ